MKPTYKELLEMSVEQLADIVVAQGAKIDSLEAQHKDLKLRNSLLRERKDLPVERLTAYDEIRAQAVEDSIDYVDGNKTMLNETRDLLQEYADNLRGEK